MRLCASPRFRCPPQPPQKALRLQHPPAPQVRAEFSHGADRGFTTTPHPLPLSPRGGERGAGGGVRAVCPRAPDLGYILPPLLGSVGRRDESRMHGRGPGPTIASGSGAFTPSMSIVRRSVWKSSTPCTATPSNERWSALPSSGRGRGLGSITLRILRSCVGIEWIESLLRLRASQSYAPRSLPPNPWRAPLKGLCHIKPTCEPITLLTLKLRVCPAIQPEIAPVRKSA